MNFVVIMTDTQNRDMAGAVTLPAVSLFSLSGWKPTAVWPGKRQRKDNQDVFNSALPR